jgi:hypothetical protein
MHHKDTKGTKKQENRSVKAKIAQSWPDFYAPLCALCLCGGNSFPSRNATRTSSLSTIFCVSTANVWFADKIKCSYGVGCWIAEVSSRTVRCLPMTWATSLNSVGPKGSNQSDAEFHGVRTELRGAELMASSDPNNTYRKSTSPRSARNH